MVNEAPKKIYISTNSQDSTYYISNQYKRLIQYTRTDAFIEKACEKLEKCMYDNLMFQGRLHRKEVIETFIEDFKKSLWRNRLWNSIYQNPL